MGAVLLAGCNAGRSATYEIRLAELQDSEAKLAVQLTIQGAGGDSLTVRGFASSEALRVSDFEAIAKDGRPLRVVRHALSARVEDKDLSIPRYSVIGAPPGDVVVRYRVRIGTRQGDPHVGFNGKAFGLVHSDFVVLAARSLVLAPEPWGEFRLKGVSFALPKGWQVAAPGKVEGSTWRPGDRRVGPYDQLISAMIGLGQFETQAVTFSGTTWRLVFPAGTSQAGFDSTSRWLTKANQYVARVFGRGLGETYTTLVLPKTSLGDEVVGEGWACGQGLTLMPLTKVRLRTYVESLVDAYVTHAPYRSSFSSQRDFWLPSGLRAYYGIKALHALGWSSEHELVSALALRIGISAGSVQLETDYSAPNSGPRGRDARGAALLYYLDHLVRESTAGSRSLDDAVGIMFRGSTAKPLWAVLPSVGRRDWDAYRQLHIAQGRMPPFKAFPALAVTSDLPIESGPVATKLLIAYSGNSAGFLENCGCKINQSGGVARRATVLRELRQRGLPVLLLDAGNAFPTPETFSPSNEFAVEELALSLRLLRSSGYAAVAVGTNELAWGPDLFSALKRRSSAPFLSPLRARGGQRLAPESKLVTVGSLKVGIVPVYEVPTYRDAHGPFENAADEYRIEDLMAATVAGIRDLSRRVDVLCLVGRASPGLIRRLVSAHPEIDVVVSGLSDGLVKGKRGGKPGVWERDRSGFVGSTLVLYVELDQFGLSSATVGLDRTGRVASAEIEHFELHDRIPDDPAVRRELAQFYDEVGNRLGGRANAYRPFASDSLRQQGSYAGAEACQSCHESQYRQWLGTAHAKAYKTLLDVHRNYQPKCVACHVVGFGARTGFHLGEGRTRLANVQCEVCHGPSADHAASPGTETPDRGNREQLCLQCHTPEHSSGFVFTEKLRRVVHGADSPMTTRTHSAGLERASPK